MGTASWAWVFGDGVGSSSIVRSPVYVYNNAGTYTATLVVKSNDNCSDTAFKIIKIEGGNDIYIPNAFTPNGDGVNDNFRALGIGIKSTEMIIYDRWGEKVFVQKGNIFSGTVTIKSKITGARREPMSI